MTNQSKILTFDQPATLLRWAGQRLGVDEFPADSVPLGILDRDESIMAVAIMNHFHDQGAWVHMAADPKRPWADPKTLAGLFYVPFIHFEMHRITGRVRADNLPAINFNLKLGFQIEGREREALDGKDVLIFGMLRRECRWIMEG